MDLWDSIEGYVHRYLEYMHKSPDLSDGEMSAGISRELKVVLVHQYDKETVEEMVEKFNLEKFLSEFGHKETQRGQMLGQGTVSDCS